LEVGAEGGFKLDLRQDRDPGKQKLKNGAIIANKRSWVWVAEMALKQGGVILAPGVISWTWVIVLLRETLSNLLGPALIDGELLFESPSLALSSS
jgi:hypothetical protein